LKTWSSSPGLATAVSEMDVRTTSRTVRRPDISIFSAEQIGRFDMNPVIAIEVLSPSEGMISEGRKVAEYLSAGSVRTADAERLLRDGKILESRFLPGFSV
jgi:Uma2 family endonuclease